MTKVVVLLKQILGKDSIPESITTCQPNRCPLVLILVHPGWAY